MVARHPGERFEIPAAAGPIFPHHETDRAVAGAFGDGTFARYWMHNGFLNLPARRCPSRWASIRLPAVAGAAGPEAMRMFVVSPPNRSPVNFEVPPARTAACCSAIWMPPTAARLFLHHAAPAGDFPGPPDDVDGEVVPEARALVPAAVEALRDDFNTPVVVAAMGEAARAANKLLDEGKGIAKPVRRRSLARLARDLRDVSGALGLLASEPAAFMAARRDRLAARAASTHEVARLPRRARPGPRGSRLCARRRDRETCYSWRRGPGHGQRGRLARR